MTWQMSEFKVAAGDGKILRVLGHTYRGLGLFILEPAKGLSPAKWSLTHLNSGHRLALIPGNEVDVFRISKEIAECGDWDFGGLRGYQNVDPDLPRKALVIVDRYCKETGKIRVGDGRDVDEGAAAEISRSRAN